MITYCRVAEAQQAINPLNSQRTLALLDFTLDPLGLFSNSASHGSHLLDEHITFIQFAGDNEIFPFTMADVLIVSRGAGALEAITTFGLSSSQNIH